MIIIIITIIIIIIMIIIRLEGEWAAGPPHYYLSPWGPIPVRARPSLTLRRKIYKDNNSRYVSNNNNNSNEKQQHFWSHSSKRFLLKACLGITLWRKYRKMYCVHCMHVLSILSVYCKRLSSGSGRLSIDSGSLTVGSGKVRWQDKTSVFQD